MELVSVLNNAKLNSDNVDVVVAPPMIYVDYVMSNLNKQIGVSAQNVSITCCGAYTGEIAAEQLKGNG